MKKIVLAIAVACAGLFAFAKDSGKVLNIYSWNDEFYSRVQSFYPGYDDFTIDGVTVHWNIISFNDDYYGVLENTLQNQDSAADDEKVDIFLLEPDYAAKYLNGQYAMDLKKLGITDSDVSNQFDFAKQFGTSNGALKAVALEVCSGGFIYRRSIAKKVFGTDDPEKIQKLASSWIKFDAMAKKLDDHGYYMMNSYTESFRAFMQNRKTPWVVDGKINVDPAVHAWIDQTKTYIQNNFSGKNPMWSMEWMYGFYLPDSHVFGYFGPDWFVNYVMASGSTLENGKKSNDWAICKGPGSFSWGGSYVCVAEGSDNLETAKNILLKLTCDEKIMEQMVIEGNVISNNKAVLEKISTDPDFNNDFLGGQNPFRVYLESANSISQKNITVYDYDLENLIEETMMDYFRESASLDQCWENFYSLVKEKYPELKR